MEGRCVAFYLPFPYLAGSGRDQRAVTDVFGALAGSATVELKSGATGLHHTSSKGKG
jgi:hypothetical protein